MRECGGVLCNTVNCVIHLKRGWDGKEGRGNKDFKKGGGGQSGSRGGCLKKEGLEPSYGLCISVNKTLNISWEILGTLEKLEIALHENDNTLYKRSEVISKCRHRNKYMLVD